MFRLRDVTQDELRQSPRPWDPPRQLWEHICIVCAHMYQRGHACFPAITDYSLRTEAYTYVNNHIYVCPSYSHIQRQACILETSNHTQDLTCILRTVSSPGSKLITANTQRYATVYRGGLVFKDTCHTLQAFVFTSVCVQSTARLLGVIPIG